MLLDRLVSVFLRRTVLSQARTLNDHPRRWANRLFFTHDGRSKGSMITRPATFRLRFLKVWRQKTPPRTYATLTGEPSTQTWPHQSQFGNIHDDQVARLAAQPLHPLALADLIRYYLTLLTQRLIAIDFNTAMVVHRSPPRLSSPPPTSPSLYCLSDSPTAFKLSATFPSS